jgi:hypothetical protein
MGISNDDCVMSAAIAVYKNKPLRGLPVVRKLKPGYKPSAAELALQGGDVAVVEATSAVEDKRTIQALEAMERKLRDKAAPKRPLAVKSRGVLRR